MRKIESQMLTAIHNNQNWQSANTSVSYNEENDVSIVRLHGNKIAEIGDNFVTIFDGGWQTVTTKSRLNVIINEFCNALTDGVFQKDFNWYIRDNNVTRDFENGYIFAWYMIKSLTKTRSANFYANQVKFLLFIVVAVLFWNSNGARQFTANSFNTLADIVQPDINYNR